MTWVDRLAARYRARIALVRIGEEVRVNASVLGAMVLEALVHPVALLRDLIGR